MSNPTGPGADALALIDKAEAALAVYKAVYAEHEGGDIPAADVAKADAAFAEFEKHEAAAKALGERAAREARGGELAAYKARLAETSGRVAVAAPMAGSDGRADHSVDYVSKGRKAERFTPTRTLTPTWTAKAEADYTRAFRAWVAGNGNDKGEDRELFTQKALSAGVDNAGGFWITPEVFSTEIISALEDMVVMRQLGTVMPAIPRGTRLVIRTASDLSDAEWTSEITTAAADTATPAGQRALTPHPMGKLVKASNVFLDAYSGGEAYIRDEIAARFAEIEETAFMTGNGQNQPQGVFSSTSSLPTDVTAASATDIVYNDLLDTVYSLKSQYHPGASWIMHRTIRKELAKLVDGNGRPLLEREANAGPETSLLGYPIALSEYAPSSSASTLYVAALGNWKKAYRIVDSLAMRLTRLVELYALTEEVGFVARKETDGMIVDGNGVVRLKMNT